MSAQPVAPATDSVGAIEQRGIDIIPPAERRGRARDLFWVWMGTNLNVFYVVNGAVIVAMGLSLAQALLAIVVANLSFFFLGLTSQQGPKTGTSTFAVSRAPFGPNGSRILAFVVWLRSIGWASSGLMIAVGAIIALLADASIEGAATVVVVVLLAAVLQALLPLFGHAAIVAAQKVMVWVSGAVFLSLAVMIAPQVELGSLTEQSASWQVVTVAIALLVGGGGLSWSNVGSDYSRYLPESTSKRSIFLWSSLGGLIPATFLEILGAGVATVAVGDATDPLGGVPEVLPAWVATPFLIFAILTLYMVNSMDLYSSGLNLQVVGIPIKRWQSVVLAGAVVMILCFLVVYNQSFNQYYESFLALLVVWLAPWFGIYITDWILRRGAYDPTALLRSARGGRYWGRRGFNVAGITAEIAGIVAAAMCMNSSLFVGPVSTATGGSDLSVVSGVLVAAAVYWLLGRKNVARQLQDLRPESDVIATGA